MNEEHNIDADSEHQSRILIEVETSYMDDQSKPEANRFVYAYTITITNQTQEDAQLISRHWVIRDAHDKVQEVTGLGVIGEQPHIAPEKSYSYTSGVVLETEIGTMEGSYQMRKTSGDLFDAPIPTFALVPPHAIH
ncbi:Co2+/Mg2+ efflux protein ApaG [Maricurvus nonylphenolicus]|uniref:Co2+/Mg2+ efflux protein ApaG n=1 Tax=Maricurvus nonylphenolicus TaxID=1008307 RepID=UPI0036F19CBA